MSTYHAILGAVAILLYLATAGLLALRLVRGGASLSAASGAGGKMAPIGLGLGAVLLHAAVVYAAVVSPGGLDLGFFNAFSLVSNIIALILLIAALRAPVEVLGIVLLPGAAVALLLGLTLHSHHVLQAGMPWQLQAHILISVAAYSVLTIAMVQAILLAIQDRQLRNHRPGGLVRGLPPLQIMEGLLFKMIGIGLALLSVALITGFFFVADIFAKDQAHKTILSLVAWCLFAILLWGRVRHGWRGRTAIRWTLSGFATLMIAYFGSKLVVEFLLHR